MPLPSISAFRFLVKSFFLFCPLVGSAFPRIVTQMENLSNLKIISGDPVSSFVLTLCFNLSNCDYMNLIHYKYKYFLSFLLLNIMNI